MRSKAASIAVFFVFIAASALSAGQAGQDASQLSLDRIFHKQEFKTSDARELQWLDDAKGYVRLEPSTRADGSKEIVAYHPADGKRNVLLGVESLIPKGESRPLMVSGYAFAADGSRVLLTVKSRENGKDEEYWVADVPARKLFRLGTAGLPGPIVAPRLSPDGRTVAYASDSNLYVESVDTSGRKQLTFDGTRLRINGDSTLRFASGPNARGLRWSPDGKRLAYAQIDTEGVKEYLIINNTDSLYPKTVALQHVKPGERLAAGRVGVVSVGGGATVWIDIPGDARMNYITEFEWAESSSQLGVEQLDRLQNRITVFLADAVSGRATPILTDSDEKFLVRSDVDWIEGGRSFLWVSEQDGWRHVYKYSRDGTQKTLLTPGRFDIASVVCADEHAGWFYYIASPDNAVYRFLFRVRLDGSGTIEKITPSGMTGTHDYTISPGGTWAFHTYSRFDTPPVVDLVRLPDHARMRVLEDNAPVRARLEEVDRSPIEFFKVDIGGGTTLDGWSVKPPRFDPARKYPVVFHVYSMPASQVARDYWHGDSYLFYLLLAQKGFLVMGIDGRGTPSLYGREWRKVIYRKHGLVPCDDIAAGVKVLLSQRPYMDANRMGVYGWSGGGLMSLLLMLRHPGLIQVAIPGAYISNHRQYNADFTERYLGLPQENPQAYDETAAVNYVDKLQGRLLLMHGTGDDNVHYQNTEVLINKLIAAGKHFVVVPYPNRTHGMTEGENTKYHQHDTMLWFFSEHLMPNVRPPLS
jgi:dipeptidyl-peptidase-4